MLTSDRVSSVLPLVPVVVVLYVFLSPVPVTVRLSGIPAVYSYDVLRADALFLGFYLGAFIALALLARHPSRWTVATGSLCCWIPLLMSFAWTITQERYFSDLLAVVAIPITFFSYNPWVDRLGMGLAVLAGAMPSLFTIRTSRSGSLALLRFLEGSALAVFPLPLGVYLFDHNEINQPVASQVLPFPSNNDLLCAAGALLVVAACLETWLHLDGRLLNSLVNHPTPAQARSVEDAEQGRLHDSGMSGLSVGDTRPCSMGKPRRIVTRKKEDEDEISRAMFLEYREENAKDMEREALGEW